MSGGGATVGTNWKNGIDLAIEEINAKGGVLGRKLEVTHADSQSNPGIARAQVQKALDGEPYVLLGPGYSGSVKVTAPLAAEAGIAADHGRRGRRTDPGRQQVPVPHLVRPAISMPKIAKYIHDEFKAKIGRDRLGQQRFRQGRPRRHRQGIRRRAASRSSADISTEAGQADFAADVGKIKAASARCGVRLSQRGGERAHPEGAEAPGRDRAADRRDHADRPEGHRARRRCRQRRARPCRPHHRRAGADLVKAFREKFVKKYNYVPDHNGIKGYIAVYMIKAVTEKMGKFDRQGASPTPCMA